MLVSISGVVIMSPITSHEAVTSDGIAYKPAKLSDSIRASSKTQGSKFSFVNSFKLDDFDANISIVHCVAHECRGHDVICWRLSCAALVDVQMTFTSRWELVLCSFLNINQATVEKCLPAAVCIGVDQSLTSCGSCIGIMACRHGYHNCWKQLPRNWSNLLLGWICQWK